MKITKQERKEILLKSKKLIEAKQILKSRFIGIDEQIDQIIDSIRPYFIFPKSLKRPLVVNLFGMTGTGKTDVITQLIDILDLNHIYTKIDVGDYANEGSDFKLKNYINEEVKYIEDQPNQNIFVFDEFQFGRTINEMGQEIDRTSLRPMWELIDSGVIYVNKYYYDLFKVYKKIQECIDNDITISNGIVNNDKVYEFIVYKNSDYMINKLDYEIAVLNDDKENNISSNNDPDIITDYQSYYKDAYKKVQNAYLLTYKDMKALCELNPKMFDNSLSNYKKFKKFRDSINHLNIHELLKYIYINFISKSKQMDKLDFSQSLIFIIGNIDEAYMMSHSSDPDSDADMFYEFSKKITLPRMKNALSTRFRMEQIGRLGNNIIIYPSFNSDSYKKIIKKYLNQRIKYFKTEFNINLEFTDNMHDIMYKESVFPTQGVRPILSSFNTMLDGYVSKIITDIIESKQSCIKMIWDIQEKEHDISEYIIKTYDKKNNEIIHKYDIKLKLENLRKSDKSESQLFTAVHESGHAILSIVLLGLVPNTITSKTASSTAHGFNLIFSPDEKTKEYLQNELAMLLGGRMAEKIIFGENNLSQGSITDLSRATSNAVAMTKIYGMCNNVYNVDDPFVDVTIKNPELTKSSEIDAIQIINDANELAEKTLLTHIDKLIELSEYLSINSKIEKAELIKFCDKWNLSYKDKDHYYNYKEQFEQFKNNLLNKAN